MLDQDQQREEAEQARANWMIEAMSTYGGRAVVMKLLEDTGPFKSTFSGEAPLTMAHLEGRRSVGRDLYLWALHSAPSRYSMMLQEHEERLSALVSEPKE